MPMEVMSSAAAELAPYNNLLIHPVHLFYKCSIKVPNKVSRRQHPTDTASVSNTAPDCPYWQKAAARLCDTNDASRAVVFQDNTCFTKAYNAPHAAVWPAAHPTMACFTLTRASRSARYGCTAAAMNCKRALVSWQCSSASRSGKPKSSICAAAKLKSSWRRRPANWSLAICVCTEGAATASRLTG